MRTINTRWTTFRPQLNSFLTNLQLIVSGQGALEYTPLFYGYYEPTETSPTAYNVSIWYLVTIFVIFLSSLIMISIRAGRGIEKEIVGKSGQIFKYSKIILSGWDCNISDQQTAILKKRLRTMQIKYELKEDQEIFGNFLSLIFWSQI